MAKTFKLSGMKKIVDIPAPVRQNSMKTNFKLSNISISGNVSKKPRKGGILSSQ